MAGIASGIIGGVASLGAAIYGGIKSGQYNRKAEQLIQNQRDDNKRWYDIKMAQDYTQRSDVQAAIKRQRELLDEQYKRAKATNAVMGGTDLPLPFSFASPSLYAASVAFRIFSTVSVSVFGITAQQEYFCFSPSRA